MLSNEPLPWYINSAPQLAAMGSAPERGAVGRIIFSSTGFGHHAHPELHVATRTVCSSMLRPRGPAGLVGPVNRAQAPYKRSLVQAPVAGVSHGSRDAFAHIERALKSAHRTLWV